MKTAYLVAYNLGCFVGWSWCLYLTCKALAEGATTSELWRDLERPLQITQTAALLEVVHAAIGLVRSPVFTTAQQVASRIFLVWGILYAAPQQTTAQSLTLFKYEGVQFELNIFTLLLAWGITEVIRYAFYAAKELGSTPYIILWLRYTTFYVLYPLGVASELALVWLALPHFKATGMWNYPMPNPFNMSFDYYYFCIFAMLAYIPGFPPLYMYMISQRRKTLSPRKEKAA